MTGFFILALALSGAVEADLEDGLECVNQAALLQELGRITTTSAVDVKLTTANVDGQVSLTAEIRGANRWNATRTAIIAYEDCKSVPKLIAVMVASELDTYEVEYTIVHPPAPPIPPQTSTGRRPIETSVGRGAMDAGNSARKDSAPRGASAPSAPEPSKPRSADVTTDQNATSLDSTDGSREKAEVSDPDEEEPNKDFPIDVPSEEPSNEVNIPSIPTLDLGPPQPVRISIGPDIGLGIGLFPTGGEARVGAMTAIAWRGLTADLRLSASLGVPRAGSNFSVLPGRALVGVGLGYGISFADAASAIALKPTSKLYDELILTPKIALQGGIFAASTDLSSGQRIDLLPMAHITPTLELATPWWLYFRIGADIPLIWAIVSVNDEEIILPRTTPFFTIGGRFEIFGDQGQKDSDPGIQ